jgi:hypothetical protein
MYENEFLPVKPKINSNNIDNFKSEVKVELPQDNIYQYKNTSTSQNEKKSIFSDSKDSDINNIINKKKLDSRNINTSPTKEELLSKNDEPNKFSWVIIGLCVVVVILIIIIIYFVLRYNNVKKEPDIQMQTAPYAQYNKQNPEFIVQPIDEVKNVNKQVDKANIKKKTNAEEMNRFLNRLETIDEEPELEMLEKNKNLKENTPKIEEITSDFIENEVNNVDKEKENKVNNVDKENVIYNNDEYDDDEYTDD